MTQQFYPVILAAISQSPIEIVVAPDLREYTAFYFKFQKPGIEIREFSSMEAFYNEMMSRYSPAKIGWSLPSLME